jgi:hypothetical protein
MGIALVCSLEHMYIPKFFKTSALGMSMLIPVRWCDTAIYHRCIFGCL